MYEDVLNESLEMIEKTRKNLLSAMYQNATHISDYGKYDILLDDPVYDCEETGIACAIGMSDYGLVMYVFNEYGQTKGVEELKTDTLIQISKQIAEKKYLVF